jgi:hypothetical protein
MFILLQISSTVSNYELYVDEWEDEDLLHLNVSDESFT